MKLQFFFIITAMYSFTTAAQTSITLDEVILSDAEKKSIIDPNKANTNNLDLVDAIYNRVSGAQIKSDYNGNKNIAWRGRQSFSTQADTVIWDIDGLIFSSPPPLDINQVAYVEVLKDLSATNKYGSQGGAGVIVVRTNISDAKKASSKNIWNTPLPLTKAQRDSIKRSREQPKQPAKPVERKTEFIFSIFAALENCWPKAKTR